MGMGILRWTLKIFNATLLRRAIFTGQPTTIASDGPPPYLPKANRDDKYSHYLNHIEKDSRHFTVLNPCFLFIVPQLKRFKVHFEEFCGDAGFNCIEPDFLGDICILCHCADKNNVCSLR